MKLHIGPTTLSYSRREAPQHLPAVARIMVGERNLKKKRAKFDHFVNSNSYVSKNKHESWTGGEGAIRGSGGRQVKTSTSSQDNNDLRCKPNKRVIEQATAIVEKTEEAVIVEETSVRGVSSSLENEEQKNKIHYRDISQKQPRRLRQLLQHEQLMHQLLVARSSAADEKFRDDDDDDSILDANCETVSSRISKLLAQQKKAFSTAFVKDGVVRWQCNDTNCEGVSRQVSEDETSFVTSRTESPLSHETEEDDGDFIMADVEHVVVDIAESFCRVVLCGQDVSSCSQSPQKQRRMRKKKKYDVNDHNTYYGHFTSRNRHEVLL